jgi:hypothetical protein
MFDMQVTDNTLGSDHEQNNATENGVQSSLVK